GVGDLLHCLKAAGHRLSILVPEKNILRKRGPKKRPEPPVNIFKKGILKRIQHETVLQVSRDSRAGGFRFLRLLEFPVIWIATMVRQELKEVPALHGNFNHSAWMPDNQGVAFHELHPL